MASSSESVKFCSEACVKEYRQGLKVKCGCVIADTHACTYARTPIPPPPHTHTHVTFYRASSCYRQFLVDNGILRDGTLYCGECGVAADPNRASISHIVSQPPQRKPAAGVSPLQPSTPSSSVPHSPAGYTVRPGSARTQTIWDVSPTTTSAPAYFREVKQVIVEMPDD